MKIKKEESVTKLILFLSILSLIAIYAIGTAVAVCAPSSKESSVGRLPVGVSEPAYAGVDSAKRSTITIRSSDETEVETSFFTSTSQNGNVKYTISYPSLSANLEEFLVSKNCSWCLIHTSNGDAATAYLIICRDHITVDIINGAPHILSEGYYALSSGTYMGKPFTTDNVGRYIHDEDGRLEPDLSRIIYLYDTPRGSAIADAMAQSATDGVSRASRATESMATFADSHYEPSPSQLKALVELMSEPLG